VNPKENNQISPLGTES